MVGDHICPNIGGIFSLKPFNLTGIAGGLLFISHSFDESLLKQYNKKGHFPHEFHAKNVLFIHSHQPDSLEMYFSNQPDNLYYLYLHVLLGFTSLSRNHKSNHFPKHNSPTRSSSGSHALCFNSLSSHDCCGGATYSSPVAPHSGARVRWVVVVVRT